VRLQSPVDPLHKPGDFGFTFGAPFDLAALGALRTMPQQIAGKLG
jgi:hypothetical protein